ncbi:OLC1v1025147C2 [Oldenlandia corymbosa var. corymbosa]|uniref:OLC1v1025147C2 n=1 Tax=Oldenlandia corymbosa var. corymbosa TaxID=529605 RepID=A0AAV1C6V5_OLDCO|nr:OLC1v1025147C2 [Oldenlandia corymbosa var. corymbosa]
MFGASVSKCKSHMRISIFLSCYYHFPGVRNPCSFTALPGFKRSSLFSCVKSIPLGVFWIWPWFQSFGCSITSHQLVCTQASSSSSIHDEVLDQILSEKKNSSESTVKICEAHVDRLCSGGHLRTAARLVQSLRDKEIPLSLRTYNRLLEAAVEQGDFDILSQSFKCQLLSSNSVPPKSFRIIANAFEKKYDDALLLKFVKEVSELALSRIVTIMNQMIYGFGDCRQVDKALLLFEHMKAFKCEPDLVTYNTILLLLGRCGRIDDMLDQFASMKKFLTRCASKVLNPI